MTMTRPPADPYKPGLTPEQQLAEITDHLVHHLTATSLVLQALHRHLATKSLAPPDLIANIELLVNETNASRKLATTAALLADRACSPDPADQPQPPTSAAGRCRSGSDSPALGYRARAETQASVG